MLLGRALVVVVPPPDQESGYSIPYVPLAKRDSFILSVTRRIKEIRSFSARISSLWMTSQARELQILGLIYILLVQRIPILFRNGRNILPPGAWKSIAATLKLSHRQLQIVRFRRSEYTMTLALDIRIIQ